MPKGKEFNEYLTEKLKDPKRALGYLNAVLEDCKDGSEESQQLLLLALKAIAQAQGMADVARKASLNRESLYKSLSKKGNPKFSTVSAVIDALGFELNMSVSPKR